MKQKFLQRSNVQKTIVLFLAVYIFLLAVSIRGVEASETISLISHTPGNSELHVPQDIYLHLEFNAQQIDIGNGLLKVKRFSDDSVIYSLDVGSGNGIFYEGSNYVNIVLPSPLPPNTKVYVEIDPAAFISLDPISENWNFPGLEGRTTWNFTTAGIRLEEEQAVSASNATSSGLFGYTVSMTDDGTRFAVTAPGQLGAYVYYWDGLQWTEEQQFSAAGDSIQISPDGNRLFLSTGSAIDVYLRSGSVWSFDQTLSASDGENIGSDIASNYDGSIVLVGAKSATISGQSYQGAAYVYTGSGAIWNEQKLIASNGAAWNAFGWGVAIDPGSNRIAVGAPWHGQGSAYIYRFNGLLWEEEAELTASGGYAQDSLGNALAFNADGTQLVAGAYNSTVSHWSQGSAYVFSRTGSTWSEEQKLIQNYASQGDFWFGWDVAFSADSKYIAVGAYGNHANYQGDVLMFAQADGTWYQEQKLSAHDGSGNDRFGFSVGLNGDGSRLVTGAYIKTINGNYAQGVAYTFGFQPNVQFSSAGSVQNENAGTGILEVVLNGAIDTDCTVDFEISGGTAQLGNDVTIATGIVSFPAGSTSAAIPISILDDKIFEPDETIILTLYNPTASVSLGSTITHTFTILDNDPNAGGGGGGGGSLPGATTPSGPTPPVVNIVGLPTDDRPIPTDTALHFHATDTSPVNPGIDLDSFKLTINNGVVPSAFIQGAVGINPAEADFHFQPSASTQLLPEGEFSLSVEVRNKSSLPASVDKSLRTQGGGYLGYHYSCINNACVQVSGKGDDTCRVHDDCSFELSVITNNIDQGAEQSPGNENGSVVDTRVTLAGNGGEDIFTFQDDLAMGGALPDFNAAVSTYLEDNDTQRALLKSKNGQLLSFAVNQYGEVGVDETSTELFDTKYDVLRTGTGAALGSDPSLEKHYVLMNFADDFFMTFADQTILKGDGRNAGSFVIQVQRLLNRKYLPDPTPEKLAQIKDEFVPVTGERYSFGVVNDQFQPVLNFDRPVAIYANIPADFPGEFVHSLTFYKYVGAEPVPVPTIVDSERGLLKGITHTPDSYYVGMKTHMGVYSDVTGSSPVAPYIYDMTSSNIVSGYASEPGTYGPENCVLRSELVKMAVGSFDLPVSWSSDRLFSDVISSDWFYPYLRGAAEAGVLVKNSQSKFYPNSCITRGDAVKIMVLSGEFPYQYYDDGSTVFTDVKKSDAFRPYLSYAKQFGIIFGYDDGTFKPQENLKRSEVTSILWHAIQTYGEQGKRFKEMWEENSLK